MMKMEKQNVENIERKCVENDIENGALKGGSK